MEHDLNQIFIIALATSIRQSTRGYWASRKCVNVNDLAIHVTSLLKLQDGQQASMLIRVDGKSKNK